MSERLFLLDGSAFAYRSYFAIRNLTNSGGQPTNAVYGFTRVLLKLLRENEPAYIAAIFDAPGKTFRHERYAEYKATRDAMPDDLIAQLPLIDEVLDAFNIPLLRVDGVEADDVIATLARQGAAQGMDVVIVTGDKDILQLVGERITVYDPYKGDNGAWYGPEEVQERYGVPPERVVDAMALIGDTSDNVPGVRGIGEKTAKSLLQRFETLDNLYQNLGQLKGKQKEKITEDKDNAFLSRELVTLDDNVELDWSPEQCRRAEWDQDKLAAVLTKLEFHSLLDELIPDATQEEQTDYQLVRTAEELEALIETLRQNGAFAIDTETTSSHPMFAELVGISVSCEAQTGYYIPVGHAPEAMVLENGEMVTGMDRERALKLLDPLLRNPDVEKSGHNIKYDWIVLRRAGTELAGVTMDTMVASYLTDPSRMRHNLTEVSLQYLKRKMLPLTDVIGKGAKAITFDKVPLASATPYACEDADITWRLTSLFRERLREREVESLFHGVEAPLIEVLVRMEMTGIAVDQGVFEDLRRQIGNRLESLEASIHEHAGGPFQINSPKQLQEVLFDKLGLKPIRKTKTGYSTDVEVLEELAREHPLPELLLEYRMLDKLRSTYVEALPRLVHPETGRIHSSFNQAVAATGRLSSSDPNLQNIPVRSEFGRQIRRAFVPEEGHQFVSADYSQIELRIMAHLSGDEKLKAAFEEGRDIHRDTAVRIFGVAPDEVTSDMRRQAKAVNFGVIYGISPYGLGRNLRITPAEAGRFISQYFAQYPGVKQWLDTTIEQARERGYVTTLLGRRRYVPELHHSNAATRAGAERAAINTPVQGSAADIIKLAMLRADPLLTSKNARMLLQVHDELLVEAPEDEAEAVGDIMRTVMEGAVELDVPLLVEVGSGSNWEELH